MLKPAGTFLQATLLPPSPPSQLRARASHRRADVGMFRLLMMIVVWERVSSTVDRGVGTCVVCRDGRSWCGNACREGLSMLYQIMKA